MIWYWYKHNHDMAISGWMRTWLRSSFLDRFILLFFHPFGTGWTIAFVVLAAMADEADLFFLASFAPWAFLALDAVVDGNHVKGDLAKLMSNDDTILATRAEYVGGHPQLPHGRFAYLTIDGYLEMPYLTIRFPIGPAEDEVYSMPLLDLEDTDQKSSQEITLGSHILATLTERQPRMFGQERVTLNIKYTDEASRRQTVELSNFFRGSGEVRNWRNYVICAQAEAETNITPHAPWRSLVSDPSYNEETHHGDFGNGQEEWASGSAFARR